MNKNELISIIEHKDVEYRQRVEKFEQAKGKLEQTKADLEQTKEKLEQTKEKLEQKVGSLQFQISQLQRLLYGAKRERYISHAEDGQLPLPFDMTEEQPEASKTEEITYKRKKSAKKHPGRIPLPDHLPVKETRIEPEEDATGLKLIGEEITDELEYSPGELYINRFIRPKYAKPANEGIVTGELPTRPIEKGIAGPGLLAYMIVEKYVYHQPIHRQLKKFLNQGVRIPANTVDGWQDRIYHLLHFLHEKNIQQVLNQGYIQVDETPLKVLDKNKKGKSHRGYYWVYHSPLSGSVFFDYQEGRGREGPRKFLKNFKGYMQTDGYNVYDYYARDSEIIQLNCMAHARRYFEKALDYDLGSAGYVMDEIQLLYKIERYARNMNLTYDERKALRLDHALPVLNRLGKWMGEQYKNFLTKSPMKTALDYTIPRWDNLMVYLYDGALEIDNNLVENAIRPNALGRKNYLFAGSHNGAQRAAMWYSFFGTCAKHNVDPYKWLKKVLEIIPDYPANKIIDLLPQNLKLD